MASLLEVSKFMAMMALTWPKYELKEGTVEIYAMILEDVPIDALTEAAKQIMAEATFFPAISEWRKAAFDIITRRMQIPNAFEAWAEVYRLMGTVGHGSTPEFSHPLIRQTVDCIGWNYLCMSEQLEFERPHFYKVYDSFLARANEDIRMLPDVRRAIEGPVLRNVNQSLKLLVKGMSHGSAE